MRVGMESLSLRSDKLKAMAKETCSVTIVVNMDTLQGIAHILSSKRAMEKAKGCRREMLKEKGKEKPECVTIAGRRAISPTIVGRKAKAKEPSNGAGKVRVVGKVKVLTRLATAMEPKLCQKLTLVEFG